MRRYIPFLVLTFVLVGCVTDNNANTVARYKSREKNDVEERRDLLAGKWLSNSLVKEGGSKMTLNQRSPDGTYVLTIRVVMPDDRIVVSQEYGVWGLSGNIYFTKMQGRIESGQKVPCNGRDSYYDDAYFVKRLTADEFDIETVTNGEWGSMKKVPDDYGLP